jgi:hypothetical protein
LSLLLQIKIRQISGRMDLGKSIGEINVDLPNLTVHFG